MSKKRARPHECIGALWKAWDSMKVGQSTDVSDLVLQAELSSTSEIRKVAGNFLCARVNGRQAVVIRRRNEARGQPGLYRKVAKKKVRIPERPDKQHTSVTGEIDLAELARAILETFAERTREYSTELASLRTQVDELKNECQQLRNLAEDRKWAVTVSAGQVLGVLSKDV